ncbi:hypothetical protein P7K49_035196 [Saguinus oedipus]|uniref:Uncharacterized protein n=1 Tax=Saguinus oedipus TaxID=9490 RepID=A0ABQ9TXK3_SAGOE|nr:hypothetical protein P7K49_035196 [Saguinus oedipus]
MSAGGWLLLPPATSRELGTSPLIPNTGNSPLASRNACCSSCGFCPPCFMSTSSLPTEGRDDPRRLGIASSAGAKVHAGTSPDAYLPDTEAAYCQVLSCRAHRPQHWWLLLHCLQSFAKGRSHVCPSLLCHQEETLEKLKIFYQLIHKVRGNHLDKFPIVPVRNKSYENSWGGLE